MVQLNSTFNSSTPHGGPPFSKWKNGFGFGKRSGPGDYVMDPQIPCQGRFTPGGKRFFETNPFWRVKAEVGQAAGFGIGDRPDYGAANEGWSIAPNVYGDLSKSENNVRRNAHRQHITIKTRFPSMDEKYRERSDPQSGPGPARYDIRKPPGTASLTHVAKMPRWSCQTRHADNVKLMEEFRKPGPDAYSTTIPPGTNSPILRGSLYDIRLKGRGTKASDTKQKGPGPGQYTLKGISDRYNIMPDYVPSYCRKAKAVKPLKGTKHSIVEGDEDAPDSPDRFQMKRAESAPGSLRVKQQPQDSR